jgi:phosphate:Na+ symporter
MFTSVLLILTGIGIFLAGIVMFSETLTRSASGKMRLLLKKVSGNRAAGFGLGLGITAVTNASAVTTVMVVGLVNAGLLSLVQATAIIFGANVGSALTTLMVSLSALNIKYYFMALAFVGAFAKLMTKNQKVALIANLMIGFGTLFVGLDILGRGFANNDIREAFGTLFTSVEFPLLLVLFGILVTALTQSSTATTAIIVVMIGRGLLGFESGVYLIIGANVGSTFPALLASITGNTNARRAAMVHFLFNVIGATILTTFVWSTSRWLIPFWTGLITGEVWQISIFNVVFNVATAMILIWFIGPISKLATKIVKEKKNDDDILRLTHLTPELLDTPREALAGTVRELKDLLTRAHDSNKLAFTNLVDRELKNRNKVNKDKARIDFLHQKVTQFLVELSEKDLSAADKKTVGEYYRFANDVRRIAGHSVFMINNVYKMKDEGITFSDQVAAELVETFTRLSTLYSDFLEIFDEDKSNAKPAQVKDVITKGNELKKFCDDFADNYLDRLNAKDFDVALGEIYYGSMISFRSIASYLTSMASSYYPKVATSA